MDRLKILESAFQEALKSFPLLPKEAWVDVDLSLLDEMGLIDEGDFVSDRQSITRTFQVIETKEKITLFNDHFAIWILPEIEEGIPTTYVFISVNEQDAPKLEMVFTARGVYNSSRLVLRVLERFLIEIRENEELIKQIGG